jgi:hypothetical protein
MAVEQTIKNAQKKVEETIRKAVKETINETFWTSVTSQAIAPVL